MTEAYAIYPQIESMARAHWWYRVRQTTYADQALEVCKGAADPMAQKAADEINVAWDKARIVECTAMAQALGSVTLRDIVAHPE